MAKIIHNNEAMKQAIHDIRMELKKENKTFISISVRQLREFHSL